MDRERLQQVHETDLTESRINVDFVEWLKTRGINWLLVVLLAMVAWVFWVRYKEAKVESLNAAFIDLESTRSAEALEMVAQDHSGVASVPELARLLAADLHLLAVQTGRNPDTWTDVLSAEAIASHRETAQRLYREVFEATRAELGRRLFRIAALFGLAAVAESAGEIDAAVEYYAQAEEAAGTVYPLRAEQARKRAESAVALKEIAPLPARADVPKISPIDPHLQGLLGGLADAADTEAEEEIDAAANQSTPTGKSAGDTDSTGDTDSPD